MLKLSDIDSLRLTGFLPDVGISILNYFVGVNTSLSSLDKATNEIFLEL